MVDEDIDVFEEEQVWWACATRMQAHQDVFIVVDVICNALDSSAQDGVCAKMGIDATRGTGVEGQRITLPPEVLSRADKLLRETEGGKIWN